MLIRARLLQRIGVAVACTAPVCALPAATAVAGTYYVYSCSAYGNSAPSFTALTGGSNWNTPNECAAGRSLEINQFTRVADGHGSGWVAYSPSPAIAIVGATTPPNAVFVDCTLHYDGFRAFFAWSGGGTSISSTSGCSPGSLALATGIDQSIPPSASFGWGVTCTDTSGCTSQVANGKILGVQGIRLTAEENTGPALNAVPASNLWYASGWVRGSWPVTLDASDPSGVCWLATAVDGKLVASWTDSAPDTSRFTQCHGSQLPGQLNTTDYANGQHTLGYAASNAANVPASTSKTISIDNEPVSLNLSGPTDAPATGGTQYVHATASAGPSGVGAIFCSVDGGPYQRLGGSTGQAPVSGIGAHRVVCFAQNDAIDPSGAPATSPVQTWDLTIREPALAAVSFVKLVGRLRCHRVLKRVHVPGRWVTVVFHHKRVRARLRGHWRRVEVTRCHRPHLVARPERRVAFGRGTTVSGWLGLANGTALAGQPVRLYAAPDDGHNHYTPFAEVSTAADGSWRARVPAGPSRLIVATYGGSSTTEPVTSPAVKLIVPARIRIVRVRPHHVRWGGTVHIEGYLAGGYLPPPPAGELVRLRIGIGSKYTTYGVKIDVTGNGRFRTNYTFGAGPPSVRRDYWFQLQALPQDDYPYAPADSGRTGVAVGG